MCGITSATDVHFTGVLYTSIAVEHIFFNYITQILLIFFSYVSGFTSVWLVLAITYENYIRLCRPQLVSIRCNNRVAYTAITAIFCFSLLVYSFALWTHSVVRVKEEKSFTSLHLVNDVVPNTTAYEFRNSSKDINGDIEIYTTVTSAILPFSTTLNMSVLSQGQQTMFNRRVCMAVMKFYRVLMTMTFIDTILTLVLPTVIIVPLVITSLFAVARAFQRKNRLRASLVTKSQRHNKSSMEAKVAEFLLAVSLTFIFLHTPGHIIRVKMLVHQYILNEGE